jgi:hypothetical protein
MRQEFTHCCNHLILMPSTGMSSTLYQQEIVKKKKKV